MKKKSHYTDCHSAQNTSGKGILYISLYIHLYILLYNYLHTYLHIISIYVPALYKSQNNMYLRNFLKILLFTIENGVVP